MKRLALLAALLVSAPAAAEPEVDDVAPRVIELPHVDLTARPIAMTVWVGARTWLDGRHYLAARIGGHQFLHHADLDRDGTNDFEASRAGILGELQLEAGWPLRIRRDVVAYKLQSTIRRVIDGQVVEERNYAARVSRVSILSVVTGARVGLDLDHVQVGIPLGLRWDRHRRTRKPARYSEAWAQVRGLAFPQAPGVGFDAEVGWVPVALGLAGFVEYIPRHAEGYGYTCNAGGAPRLCTPDQPITIFDSVPFRARLTLGIRLIVHLPR